MAPPASRPLLAPVSAAGPAAAGPLGFNCPSCGVVLTLPNPKAYDGRPGPCPNCAALVVPPRVVQPGTVELDCIDLHPLPGLSGVAGGRIKMPRAVHRPRRRLDADGYGPDGRSEDVVMSAQA